MLDPKTKSDLTKAIPGINLPSWCLDAIPYRSSRLDNVPLLELSDELVGRLIAGEGFAGTHEVEKGFDLWNTLSLTLDVSENRFSRQCFENNFYNIYSLLGDEAPDLKGATIVDLGCGSWNPLARNSHHEINP